MLNTKMQGYPVRHGLAALKPSSPMLSPLALAPSLPSNRATGLFLSATKEGPSPPGTAGRPRGGTGARESETS